MKINEILEGHNYYSVKDLAEKLNISRTKAGILFRKEGWIKHSRTKTIVWRKSK